MVHVVGWQFAEGGELEILVRDSANSEYGKIARCSGARDSFQCDAPVNALAGAVGEPLVVWFRLPFRPTEGEFVWTRLDAFDASGLVDSQELKRSVTVESDLCGSVASVERTQFDVSVFFPLKESALVTRRLAEHAAGQVQ